MSIQSEAMAPTTTDPASSEENRPNSAYKNERASYSSDSDTSSQEDSSAEHEGSPKADSSLQEGSAQPAPVPLGGPREPEGSYARLCSAEPSS